MEKIETGYTKLRRFLPYMSPRMAWTMDSPLTPGHWQTLQAIAESLDSLDLDQTLLTIRNALVERAGFDRAGILLVDESNPDFVMGTWGTASGGGPQAEHDWRSRIDEHPNTSLVLRGEAPYILRHTELPHIPVPPDTPDDLLQHAIVPLKSHDRMLGVISVDNLLTQRSISDADVQFLLLVARHVTLAIDKARSHLRERRQAEEISSGVRQYVSRLEGLQKASAEVASALSLSDALSGILTSAGEVLNADRLAVWQLTSDGAWRCSAWRGLSEPYRKWTEDAQNETRSQTPHLVNVLRSGEPIVVPDVNTLPEWASRRVQSLEEGVQSLIVYPLVVAGELLGTLVFYGDRPHRFSEEDFSLGRLFAHHAAMAIHKAKAFEDLREARDDLTRRVEERTRQLESAQEQLIRTERLAAIGQVSATIAHDLRGPLGVINNTAYLLHIKLGKSEEKVAQAVKVLQNQVQNCTHIINDLLDFSRDLQPNLRPSKWAPVVRSGLSALPPQSQVDLQVEVDEDAPLVRMDPDLMVRAVVNLIQNAVQITGEAGGGTVRVTSGCDDAHSWLKVSDNGPGVPEELRGRIFEPFFTTRKKGTGLGLSLVKRILDAHNGEILIEDGEPNGVCFTLKLPLPEER